MQEAEAHTACWLTVRRSASGTACTTHLCRRRKPLGWGHGRARSPPGPCRNLLLIFRLLPFLLLLTWVGARWEGRWPNGPCRGPNGPCCNRGLALAAIPLRLHKPLLLLLPLLRRRAGGANLRPRRRRAGGPLRPLLSRHRSAIGRRRYRCCICGSSRRLCCCCVLGKLLGGLLVWGQLLC